MKLCKDCRWARDMTPPRATTKGALWWLCGHPSAAVPAMVNPVTGEVREAMIDCSSARIWRRNAQDDAEQCGPDGQFWEPLPAPSITVEVATVEEDTTLAGWAEGVATPDDDVGFVLTTLPPSLTGLPMPVAVGDDTPMVIASPERLTASETAALRHWVIRHQAVLKRHWQNEIDSGELIDGIRLTPPPQS